MIQKFICLFSDAIVNRTGKKLKKKTEEKRWYDTKNKQLISVEKTSLKTFRCFFCIIM